MKIKILRILETIFLNASYFFEDWADSIDTRLHDSLRSATAEMPTRVIGDSSYCPLCNEIRNWEVLSDEALSRFEATGAIQE